MYKFTLWLAIATMSGLTGCGGCGGEGPNGDGSFPNDVTPPASTGHGTLSLAWELRDLGGLPIQCGQVGAGTVALALRTRDQAQGTTDSFTCNASPATSKDLLPGIYDVSFELYADGNGQVLATAPDQNSVVIKEGMTTPLAPIEFDVDAQGDLVLTLTTPPTTSNCKSPLRMGAGISGIAITLVHENGGCAPVTFIHTKGGTTLTPYTVSCSSPPVVACIENDERLTTTGLASGPYTLHTRGKIGAIECWKSDDALQVPARGTTLAQTVDLTFQSADALCKQ